MVSRFIHRTSQFVRSHGFAFGALVLVATACTTLVAQTATFVRPAGMAAKPSAVQSAAKPSADGSQEHLQVWGKWKIVVKNADGTTASTTEFENSLSDSGFTAENLLAGIIVPNYWSIYVSGNGNGTCGSGIFYCIILPSATSTAGANTCNFYASNATKGICFSGLTTSIPANAFQLVGGYTATTTGVINTVYTNMAFCPQDPATSGNTTTPSATSPATCAAGAINGNRFFTTASSSTTPAFTAVSVTAGQIVQITVAISFS